MTTTIERTDFEHINSDDVMEMHEALREIDRLVQKAKDTVNKFGQGGMFHQEEFDAYMLHTAQLFRLHKTASLRISGISHAIESCIHCGQPLRWHNKKSDLACPENYWKPGHSTAKFELRKVKHDAWKNA